MKRVAVIGAGIVGSTAAYTLAKYGCDVTVYDAQYAQGTKAAVGIICPWVNQRRNKRWYRLARDGAEFYNDLIQDFPNQTFYRKFGTLITHDSKLEKLYDLACQRYLNAPAMENITYLEGDDLKEFINPKIQMNRGIYVQGGAQVDGALLVETLLGSYPIAIKYETATVHETSVNGIEYDVVVVASGPWVNDVLTDYEFEVYPQKGQLVEIEGFLEPNHQHPVIMPQGELDLLFGNEGQLVVGASHENHKSDVIRDLDVENRLIEDAKTFIPSIDESMIDRYRIGIRAYTKANEPFYGPCNATHSVYVASGLGSSGLTTGPIIGYRIARSILGDDVDFSDFNPQNYIKKAPST